MEKIPGTEEPGREQQPSSTRLYQGRSCNFSGMERGKCREALTSYRQMEWNDNKELCVLFIMVWGMKHHSFRIVQRVCAALMDQQREEQEESLPVGPALLHEGVHLCWTVRGALHALPLLYEANNLWAFHFLGEDQVGKCFHRITEL